VEASEDAPFILHPGEFVLGSTLESVTLPDDLVARLEGKSSLGRLGLLIHSSLPGSEPVLFLRDDRLTQIPIEHIVRKQLQGYVVAFDKRDFSFRYQRVVGWHETPPDRIFEVVLASGRRIRLTGGHVLFTLGRGGEIEKLRVTELGAGAHVAIPGSISDPEIDSSTLNLLSLVPEHAYKSLVCGGPSVAAAFGSSDKELTNLLRLAGIGHHGYYRARACLPLQVALQHPDLVRSLGPNDWLAARGGQNRLPVICELNDDVAWLLGLYVAEGCRRANQVTLSNTKPEILDRVQRILGHFNLPVYRTVWAITTCSTILSRFIGWTGIGDGAQSKRVPRFVLGWPRPLLTAFLEGFVDGDGSREPTRVSLWTSSEELVGDLLLVCARLGKRASASVRHRAGRPLWQVSVPHREHKLLTAIPSPDQLLLRIRRDVGLSQVAAAAAAGLKHNTQLNNIEHRRPKAVRGATLRKLRVAYASADRELLRVLDRLVDGDLLWDLVVEVRDTGIVEPVFDLEVASDDHAAQNFVAGFGGVCVSNTAGFVDAGFSGQLTLELSNVANLPIAIYPRMPVGQLCLFRMTSPAERPYGSDELRSKYQAQRGPTSSRFHENFRSE
jgi:dCTP deaminase